MPVTEERWGLGTAKKRSGQRKSRPDRKKNGPDDKNGRGEPAKPVFTLQQAAGWLAREAGAFLPRLSSQAVPAVRIAGSVPEPISAAIRAGKGGKATAKGMSFEVTPVQVDSGACESVPAGQLGPVLMKIDVEVKPAK